MMVCLGGVLVRSHFVHVGEITTFSDSIYHFTTLCSTALKRKLPFGKNEKKLHGVPIMTLLLMIKDIGDFPMFFA